MTPPPRVCGMPSLLNLLTLSTLPTVQGHNCAQVWNKHRTLVFRNHGFKPRASPKTSVLADTICNIQLRQAQTSTQSPPLTRTCGPTALWVQLRRDPPPLRGDYPLRKHSDKEETSIKVLFRKFLYLMISLVYDPYLHDLAEGRETIWPFFTMTCFSFGASTPFMTCESPQHPPRCVCKLKKNEGKMDKM